MEYKVMTRLTAALVLLFYATVASAAELYCYTHENQTICEDGHYEYYCYVMGNQTICEADRGKEE
jgi:hypothetical protein